MKENYLYNKKRKGKYYIEGRLEYEGEYLYDKKWNGKRMDYNPKGKLIFEGDYVKGQLKNFRKINNKI